MIYYLVSPQGYSAIQSFALSWGPAPESRIRLMRYDDLAKVKTLASGVYVFSDLERLSPVEIGLARHVWETLSGAGPGVRLLNNPSRVLCRYDLQRRLYEMGINRFRAVRATEPLRTLRYPVFVREEHEHTGNLTPLIGHPDDLNRRLRSLRLKGYRLRDLLVIEFCDTSDQHGIFRKYSAIRVGDIILPRHLLFSRKWNLKRPDLDGPSLDREKEDYLEGHPHRDWLRAIFDTAGIEYGRIDYSFLGKDPQVWEINTNPTVKKLTPRLTEALEALEGPLPSGGAIPLTIDPEMARSVRTHVLDRLRGRSYRKMVGTFVSSQWLRPLLPLAKSLLHGSFGKPQTTSPSHRGKIQVPRR
jgi:hypothetical protein